MTEVTNSKFDAALAIVVKEETGSDERIFSIPGIYEILSEHFNNAAIDLVLRDRL